MFNSLTLNFVEFVRRVFIIKYNYAIIYSPAVSPKQPPISRSPLGQGPKEGFYPPGGGGVSAVKWSSMLENENSERPILCGLSSQIYPPFHTLLDDSTQFLCKWGY